MILLCEFNILLYSTQLYSISIHSCNIINTDSLYSDYLFMTEFGTLYYTSVLYTKTSCFVYIDTNKIELNANTIQTQKIRTVSNFSKRNLTSNFNAELSITV